ncbi:MAG: EAL domain-containing protein [Armatimonadetes bacterium]|nr:EAL domain-containing protein [Armatimonadota bacterium]
MSPHLSETQTQILTRIAGGAPLAETLDELTHRLQSASPTHRVAFLTVRKDAINPLRLRVSHAPDKESAFAVAVESVVNVESLLYKVVFAGQTELVARAEQSRVPEIRFDDAEAVYLAPLTDSRSDANIGVCVLFLPRGEEPTPEENDLLSLAASLAGLALSRDLLEQERKRGEEALSASLTALRLQTLTDPLTGLPNRRQFLQSLTDTIGCAHNGIKGGTPCRPAVLFVDLDRFKLINDTLGHAAGDTLLLEISSRFSQVVGADDVVARLGGDEFVILLRHADADAARQAATRLRIVAAKPVVIHAQEAYVAASIGIALWNADAFCSAETLLQNADTAMYHAKKEGGSGFAIFTEAMGDVVMHRASLESDLRRALSRNELFLHFQPQFDLLTGRVIGAEALARWNHPRRGEITPAEFVPIAEESGLIEPMGEWILREACRQGAVWQNLPRPLRVAVNLSARQFAPRNELAKQVERVLAETGFRPSLLDLEITESVLLTKNVPVTETLAAMKKLGARLLLDDFGTGYGSLIYLRQFPIEVLKVDSSFVQGVSLSKEDAAIVRAVIDLAHALGMRVVAEGVETEEQLAELTRLGCDALQGFLLGRPVPAAEIPRFFDVKWGTAPPFNR